MDAVRDAAIWFKDIAWSAPPVWRWACLAVVCIAIGWVARRSIRS